MTHRPTRHRLVTWLPIAISALLAATIALFGGGSAAYASDEWYGYDDGNPQGDQLTCEQYEICFSWSSSETSNLKLFWYGANHGEVSPQHITYYFHSNFANVPDNAVKIRNRDSECRVYVWDINQYGQWLTYDDQAANSGSYKYLSTANVNNGHTRCQTTENPATY